jgi:hypothetical protein
MFDLGREDDIVYLWFRIGSLLAVFNFAERVIALTKLGSIPNTQPLPFFEPDFSDMDELLNKLKLYSTFS